MLQSKHFKHTIDETCTLQTFHPKRDLHLKEDVNKETFEAVYQISAFYDLSLSRYYISKLKTSMRVSRLKLKFGKTAPT